MAKRYKKMMNYSSIDMCVGLVSGTPGPQKVLLLTCQSHVIHAPHNLDLIYLYRYLYTRSIHRYQYKFSEFGRKLISFSLSLFRFSLFRFSLFRVYFSLRWMSKVSTLRRTYPEQLRCGACDGPSRVFPFQQEKYI